MWGGHSLNKVHHVHQEIYDEFFMTIMIQIPNADVNDDVNDDLNDDAEADADSQSIMIHILTKWSSAQVIVEQPDKYQRKEKNNFYYNTEIYHVIHTSYL